MREAVETLTIGAEVVVLVTPHGSRDGVYARAEGDLSGLGVLRVGVSASVEPHLAQSLAESWGTGMVELPLDHGAVVALSLLRPAAPVVVCSLQGWTDPGRDATPALRSAERLAAALGSVAGDLDVAIVATGHTSAALSPRAPLTERASGHQLADTILAALTDDVGRLATIPADAWEAGGGCGAGPLSLLGHLFGGRVARVAVHDVSVGVGYLVAEIG